MKKLFFSLVLCLSTTFSIPAIATETITMIIPFGPGNATDLSARAVVDAFNSYNNGTKIVVENIPGAKGIPAINRLKSNSQSSILVGNTSINIINHAVEKDLPYSPQDFDLIGTIAFLPHALYGRPDLNVTDGKQWIKFVKESKTPILIGVDATVGEAIVKYIKKKFDLDQLKIVMYKSNLDHYRELRNGILHFALGSTNPTILSASKSGDIKFVGTMWKNDIEINGAVIKSIDLEIRAHELYGMATLQFSSEMKLVHKEVLRKDLRRAITDPRVIEKISAFGGFVGDQSPQDLARYINSKIHFVKDALK